MMTLNPPGLLVESRDALTGTVTKVPVFMLLATLAGSQQGMGLVIVAVTLDANGEVGAHMNPRLHQVAPH